MDEYYRHRRNAELDVLPELSIIDTENPESTSLISDYDYYRRRRIMQNSDDEGWASELRHYLKDIPANVTKDTDIIEWWQVRLFSCLSESFKFHMLTLTVE
jgi:hypothetical protein